MNRELKTQSAARTLGCGRTRFCCCSVIALLVRDNHILYISSGTLHVLHIWRLQMVRHGFCLESETFVLVEVRMLHKFNPKMHPHWTCMDVQERRHL